MSFNFNAFKDRIQRECYLLLEFIKISLIDYVDFDLFIFF